MQAINYQKKKKKGENTKGMLVRHNCLFMGRKNQAEITLKHSSWSKWKEMEKNTFLWS